MAQARRLPEESRAVRALAHAAKEAADVLRGVHICGGSPLCYGPQIRGWKRKFWKERRQGENEGALIERRRMKLSSSCFGMSSEHCYLRLGWASQPVNDGGVTLEVR